MIYHIRFKEKEEKIIIILQILSLIIAIIFIIQTLAKLIKIKDKSYIPLLTIEILGIFINLIFLLMNKKPKTFGISIIVICSIIIPLCIYLIEKFWIPFPEICLDIKIFFNKNNKEELLNNFAIKYPENFNTHVKLAKNYADKKELEKAEDEYIRALRIDTGNAKIYFELGKILLEENKREDAIESFAECIKLKPDYTEASLILGNIYYEDEKFKKAINVFEKALEYNPKEYYLYYYIGMTYTRMSDFSKAKSYYEKAAILNSLKDISNLNLGQIDIIFRDYDEAEKYFFETINSDDEEIVSISYFYLAKIKLIQKDYDMAIKYANLAIEINPKLMEKAKNDDSFIVILSKLNKPKEKDELQTKLNEKQVENIIFLTSTYEITQNLSEELDMQDMNSKEIKEKISKEYDLRKNNDLRDLF